MRKIFFTMAFVVFLLIFLQTYALCYTHPAGDSQNSGEFWVNTPERFVIYIRLLKFYTGENGTGDEVTVIENPDGVSANVCQTGGAYSIFASGIRIPVGTYRSYRMTCRAKFRMKGIVQRTDTGNWYYTSSSAGGNAGGPVPTEAGANLSAEECELNVPSSAPEPDDLENFTVPVTVTEEGTTNIRFYWSPTNELELWEPQGGGYIMRPTTPNHEQTLVNTYGFNPDTQLGDWGPRSGRPVD